MKTTITVKGMSCAHCVAHVTQALEGVPGVKSAKVSLKHGTAVVNHQDDADVNAMKAAVTNAGFECPDAGAGSPLPEAS